MDSAVSAVKEQVRDVAGLADRLREEIATVIVGQCYLVDRLLVALRPRRARRRDATRP
jgi:hypothetical protein